MSKYIIKTELNPMGGVIRSLRQSKHCRTGLGQTASC